MNQRNPRHQGGCGYQRVEPPPGKAVGTRLRQAVTPPGRRGRLRDQSHDLAGHHRGCGIQRKDASQLAEVGDAHRFDSATPPVGNASP